LENILLKIRADHRSETGWKSGMNSFSDTKSPSLIHLHHPTHLQQRRQIKLSLGDESRLSSPPRHRDVQNVNFHSQVPLNIINGDSNRIFIDRTNFVGEFHIWMFKTDVLSL
jgi:hypothetical protein